MKTYERTITEGRIAEAYVALTVSRWTDLPLYGFASIRLLREALPEIPREDLDDVLTGLYTAQVINLIPQSNQQALSEADRAAAVRCGGEDKHLMSWPAS